MNHVNVGDLGIIEVIFHLVKIFLRQALIWLVNRPLLLIFGRVMEHAFFVPIHTEPVKILYAGDVFLKVIKLRHLLQLLKSKLLHKDRLHD